MTHPHPEGWRQPVAGGPSGAVALSGAVADGMRDGVTSVTRGLRDGARRVTEGLGQGDGHLRGRPGESLGGRPGAADTVPPYPALPVLPPARTLPGLIPLPLLPTLQPAPVTGIPSPGGPADPAPGAGCVGDGPCTGTSDTGDTAHDPYPRATAPVPALRHRPHGQRPAFDGPSGSTPSAPSPHPADGEPDGVLGNRAATDGTASRYGDALALTPVGRTPLVLVPGAAVRVDAAETRDRCRDIPVPPA